jgi:hypothetical protein
MIQDRHRQEDLQLPVLTNEQVDMWKHTIVHDNDDQYHKAMKNQLEFMMDLHPTKKSLLGKQYKSLL